VDLFPKFSHTSAFFNWSGRLIEPCAQRAAGRRVRQKVVPFLPQNPSTLFKSSVQQVHISAKNLTQTLPPFVCSRSTYKLLDRGDPMGGKTLYCITIKYMETLQIV
jgi:hypothetical protein